MEFKQDSLERLHTDLVLDKAAALPEGQFQAVLSTSDLDRHGEIVSIQGMSIPKDQVFKMYYNHQTTGTSLPIGKWLRVWKSSGKLMGQGQLDMDDPFATRIYNKILNGFIDSISIGFYPQEFDSSNSTWTKSTLVEASVVAEPANVHAVITNKQLEDEKEFQKLLIVKLAEVVEKGAIPYKKFPLADKSAKWDGPAQIKSASIDDLRLICAWVDSANPDIKGSYKLPHHMATGDHATVWRAVSTAMGALNAARMGVKIPDSDRQAVYNHLAKHYKEFGETPPRLKSLDEIQNELGEDGAEMTEIETALKELKSRVGAVEDTLKASTEKPAIKSLIKVRMAAKQVDHAAEELNKTIKVKIKETN